MQLSRMNLDQGKSTSWSKETSACLIDIQAWLVAQADCLEMLGVAGGKELGQAYKQLAMRIAGFNSGGPAALDSARDMADIKATALRNALRE